MRALELLNNLIYERIMLRRRKMNNINADPRPMPKSKVQMELYDILKFLKHGLENGRVQAALAILNDLIKDLEDRGITGEEKDGKDK